VLIGPRTVAELEANLAAAEWVIPAALWSDLATSGAIAADNPRPTSLQSH
jgi:aryl-alcohol dehydrogenase-like predicted oxidoreductase